MKLEKTLKLTYTAMLTAMVCVATMLIRIPTMVGYTNLGDGFILLSAFLFGPFYGAVAGGIGSMLADILSGYAFYAPATLVIKGLIAVIAALAAGRPCVSAAATRSGKRSLPAWSQRSGWQPVTGPLRPSSWAKQRLLWLPSPIILAQGLVGVVLGMVLYYALSKLPMWKKVQLYA